MLCRATWWIVMVGTGLALGMACGTASVDAAEAPLVAQYLESGQLAAGETALLERLQANPQDEQARFGLGVLQFLRAVEHLGQSHFRYGLLQDVSRAIPLLRLPVPENPDPEELTYDAARDVVQTFVDRLATAEETLAQVDTADVKLPLHFGRIRLDVNGDGIGDDEEVFWQMFTRFNNRVTQKAGEDFIIAFDGGDVHWLRGYCHLLSAFGEFILAYDWEDQFDRCARLFIPRADSSYEFFDSEPRGGDIWDYHRLLDAIAFIHTLNFELQDPERLAAVRQHLLEMIGQSRQSWERILAETDNDHEWLPNPEQTGVIPSVRIEQSMITEWHSFLSEAEALLEGQKLVPFWRGSAEYRSTHGINFKRVFTEPTAFDLVLWVQGTAAAPYLEEGPLTDPAVWARLERVFQGQFFGFAIWFN